MYRHRDSYPDKHAHHYAHCDKSPRHANLYASTYVYIHGDINGYRHTTADRYAYSLLDADGHQDTAAHPDVHADA